MAGLVKGIHHIALKCAGETEFQKTIGFYKDLLGFEVIRSWGEGKQSGIMLGMGGCIIEIFANGSSDLEQGAIRHFALATDDTDACVKAMKEAGYVIFEEPHDIVIPADKPYPARIAFGYGPAGEEIEFFQEK